MHKTRSVTTALMMSLMPVIGLSQPQPPSAASGQGPHQAPHQWATSGQPSPVFIQLPEKVPPGRCNIAVFVPGQPHPIEREADGPKAKVSFELNHQQPGPLDIHWKGKPKTQGSPPLAGCQAQGVVKVFVRPNREQIVEGWSKLFASFTPAQSECVKTGLAHFSILWQSTDPSAQLISSFHPKAKAVFAKCDSFLAAKTLWGNQDSSNFSCTIGGKQTQCEGSYAERTPEGKLKAITREQAMKYHFDDKPWTTGQREAAAVRAERQAMVASAPPAAAEKSSSSAEAKTKADAEAKAQRDKTEAEAKARKDKADAEERAQREAQAAAQREQDRQRKEAEEKQRQLAEAEAKARRDKAEAEERARREAMMAKVREEEKNLKFSSPGVIFLEGKKIDYLDLAAESASKVAGKDVVIYGYTFSFSETDPHKAWGYRFDFRMYSGEWLANMKMMNGTDPRIDIVLAPFQSKTYPEPLTDTFDEMRKNAFKSLTLAQSGKALIKITGKVQAFSNTGKLYIGADSIDIIR